MAIVRVVTHNSLRGVVSLARLTTGVKKSANMWTGVLEGTCRLQSAHVSRALRTFESFLVLGGAADNVSNQFAPGEIISVIAWSSTTDGYIHLTRRVY